MSKVSSHRLVWVMMMQCDGFVFGRNSFLRLCFCIDFASSVPCGEIRGTRSNNPVDPLLWINQEESGNERRKTIFSQKHRTKKLQKYAQKKTISVLLRLCPTKRVPFYERMQGDHRMRSSVVWDSGAKLGAKHHESDYEFFLLTKKNRKNIIPHHHVRKLE